MFWAFSVTCHFSVTWKKKNPKSNFLWKKFFLGQISLHIALFTNRSITLLSFKGTCKRHQALECNCVSWLLMAQNRKYTQLSNIKSLIYIYIKKCCVLCHQTFFQVNVLLSISFCFRFIKAPVSMWSFSSVVLFFCLL